MKSVQLSRRSLLSSISAVMTLGVASGVSSASTPADAADSAPGAAWASRPDSRSAVRVMDVFGLHDSPYSGGSTNVDLALSDFQRLGARSVFVIEPTDELLQRFSDTGATVLIRAMMPDNRCDPSHVDELSRRAAQVVETPLIQPFNETNLSGETGGIARLPEDHVDQDLLPAADLITSYGGTVLLTPMAQGAWLDDIDEVAYLVRMLDRVAQRKSRGWIRKNLALSLHAYTFAPGDDPWERVAYIQDRTRDSVGMELPIYVTEAGLYQGYERLFDEWTYASDTLRQLNTEIPWQLHETLQAVCFWLYANNAQAPMDAHANSALLPFESAVWRGVGGETVVYQVVEANASMEPALE